MIGFLPLLLLLTIFLALCWVYGYIVVYEGGDVVML